MCKRLLVILLSLSAIKSYSNDSIQWNRLALHSGMFLGGGITTLTILESLPDDVTAWSSTERREVPLFKRYKENFKKGPVWDKDRFTFNYILHPYAGAVYYTAARGAGCNWWQSSLYSAFVSTVLWEYGIECFNEVPSANDLIITPVVGSLIGEGFYTIKRNIVKRNHIVLGHKWIGKTICWVVDPFNEFGNLFLKKKDCLTTSLGKNQVTLSYRF